MCAHALSLSHPGIRCRCLAAYGDAVSAVKWYFFFSIFACFLVHNHVSIHKITPFMQG